jgi:glycine dehydrogenase
VSDRQTLAQLVGDSRAAFAGRHIGPSEAEVEHMLAAIGQPTLAALSEAAVPDAIQSFERLSVPEAGTEAEVLGELRDLAARNRPLRTMIGLGYHATITPPVLVRNIVEDPSWYTAYTPYQPEISQGRLEALLNFQTMVADLTGLTTANASMLDEATAAAEAVALMRRKSAAATDAVVVIDADCLPQSIAVVRTRCEPLGLPVVVADLTAGPDALPTGDVFGVLLPSPGASGRLVDWAPLIAAAHERGALVAVTSDLLSLCLVTPPGEQGADVACGTTQRFGVPLGFGGPHAGYLAVRAGLERSLPGRLVGVSVDADGHPATRLALQTREQHIRRERATSNICTAQVLLAVLASMYAVYHGPDGLRRIAERVHRCAVVLAHGLRTAGVEVVHDAFFDTVLVRIPGRADAVAAAALEAGINVRRVDADHVAAACDETTDRATVATLWRAFGHDGVDLEAIDLEAPGAVPESLARATPYLEHPVFSAHRSETSMLRYLRRLSDRDIALDRSMIPLGSCTMKLNATAEMASITWPGFADLHPLVPLDQAEGYLALIADVERWLGEITGYDAVSLQPNAGSQGELAGLLAIRAWHRSRHDEGRDVCLIPASAHGTNAASAAMGGMRVVVVACDDHGDVDLGALRAALAAHEGRVAAAMVTYPSTHGVFEAGIAELCALVHDAGGQVYVDGANLNALVGLAKPGRFGADVSHLNLHKTFCIPHGGGGPGVGPVAVRAHLAPFLPNHPLVAGAGPPTGVGPVAGAPWGSAGILPIPWAYVRLMGPDGLRRATQVAILGANYVARRLAGHYPVLYTGRAHLVAHECILDLRPLTAATGVTGEDIAKRLIDHGFHAPTMSFPVAGTLMIEPTESEDLAELDRFVDAMIAIRTEIDEVPAVVKDAPFTAESLLVEPWDRPYTRAQAGYPAATQRGPRGAKYWPPVRRIDGGHGDRNLVCSCPPLDAYEQA